jgi:hypothetical protein
MVQCTHPSNTKFSGFLIGGIIKPILYWDKCSGLFFLAKICGAISISGSLGYLPLGKEMLYRLTSGQNVVAPPFTIKPEQVSKMEQHALRSVNNCLNTNIYSYSGTSGRQSSNLYINVVHIFNTSVN